MNSDAQITLPAADAAELAQHEAVIERGLQTFYDVGTALLSIRDKRLYRADYSTFEDYCRERWQMSRIRAYQLMEAAGVVGNLLPIGNTEMSTMVNTDLQSSTIVELPTSERQARELVGLEADAQRLAWEVVQQTAPAGKITAAHVKSVVNVLKEVVTTGAIDNGSGAAVPVVADVLKAAVTEETYERMRRQEAHIVEKLTSPRGVPAALQMSESNEWYTPKQYVDAARFVMGAIDLDPASNPTANTVVQAARYYTIVDNGLQQEWRGRVWLNPPYGRDGGESNQAIWSARLIDEYRAGNVLQAVLLVNAVTDRAWFQPLWAFPICFTDHRIRFYDVNGESGSPTHGNALVYLGDDCERFAQTFSAFGVVVTNVLRKAS